MVATRPPIKRFATIDALIRAGKYPNARILSENLEVSDRTILRDIEYMREQLGAPIEYNFERKGFFYAISNFNLPSVRISEGELVALILAEKVLRQYRNTPYEKELRSAYEKLAANLPEGVSIDFKEIDRMFSFHSPQTTPFEIEVFTTLSEAVLKRKQLRITYHSLSSKETTQRTVDPYHLGNIRGNWYLFGHCHLRNEVRMFSPSRIKKIVFTGKTVRVPPDFSSRAYLESSFNVIKGTGKYIIKVKFNPSVAGYITERTWHTSQKVKCFKDGSCVLSVSLNSLDEMEHWVLSWGPAAKVISPKELIRRVSAKLRSAASQYAKLQKKTPGKFRLQNRK